MTSLADRLPLSRLPWTKVLMASDSSSGFRPEALHISVRIHKIQPRGWRKRTNEQTRVWVSFKRKMGEIYETLLCSSASICRLSQACILRETSTKLLRMLTHLFAWVNPASVGQLVLAVVFLTSVESLLCPADIFSLPPSADCVLPWTAISSRLVSSAFLCQLPLSVFSGSFLSSSTSGLGRDLALRPFLWV